MAKQFHVFLAKPDREWVMVVVFPLLFITNAVVGVKLLPVVPKNLTWLLIAGGAAFLLGMIELTHRLLSEAAVVTVADDELTVQYLKNRSETTVLFSDVTECYHAALKGAALLRIRFRNGKVWCLRAYWQPGRFLAMARQVGAAHFRYVHGYGPPPADAWVPPFFKRPLATAGLLGLAAALGIITWLVGVPDGSGGGSFLLLMSYVGFVVYAFIWLRARQAKSID